MTDYVIVPKEWLKNLRHSLLESINISGHYEKVMQEVSNIISNRLNLGNEIDIASINHNELQAIMWNYAIPDMVSDYVQGNLNDSDYISESEHSLKVLFASLYGLSYDGKDAYKKFTEGVISVEERKQVADRIIKQYEEVSK